MEVKRDSFPLVTQQTACQLHASPPGLEANNVFPHLGGSKSCAVFDNLHNDDVTMEPRKGRREASSYE